MKPTEVKELKIEEIAGITDSINHQPYLTMKEIVRDEYGNEMMIVIPLHIIFQLIKEHKSIVIGRKKAHFHILEIKE